MALLDEENPSDDDLLYKVNHIVRVKYERPPVTARLPYTVGIIEDFLRDIRSLAIEQVAHSTDLRTRVLDLFFLHAVLVAGSLPRGCVTYKSHWSGFAATTRQRALVDAVRRSYIANKAAIMRSLERSTQMRLGGLTSDHALLAEWPELLSRYLVRADRHIATGAPLLPKVASASELADRRLWLQHNVIEPNAFLKELYRHADTFFILGQHPSVLKARVATNLLYLLTSAVGLTYLDKMSLCYFASAAVEEAYSCDLTDLFRASLLEINQMPYKRVDRY